jgi:Uma2 family endonuclease
MSDHLAHIEEPVQRLNRAAFRAWADAQPRGRYERHGGVVIAMAPERSNHARLKATAWRLLREGIIAAGIACEAFPDGMTVEIGEDHDFEPDAIVRCGFPRLGNVTRVPDPLIIVEVLSPSTSVTDRTEKFSAYFRLPSVQHYLIVWSDRIRVVHHRRDGDTITTEAYTAGTVALAPPGLSLDVGDLYAEVDDLS